MTGGGLDTLDRGPTRFSLVVSVLVAAVTAVAVGRYSPGALALAGAGVVVLVGGLVAHRHGGVLVGTLGLFVGVTVAGTAGAPVPVVVAGVAGTMIAWDAGDNALGLGSQAGRRSRSVRNEAVHLAGTVAVVALTAGVGYGVFRVATGGQPVTALVLLLLAGALLIAVLSE